MMAMRPVWGALLALSAAWAGGRGGEFKTFGCGYGAGGTVGTKTYPDGRVVRACADELGRTGAAKYNERDQLVRMRLSVGSNAEQVCGTTGDEWCIELGYGTASGNNGNVREQKIWAKKGNGTYLQIGQTYDGMNRLTVFGESVLGGGSFVAEAAGPPGVFSIFEDDGETGYRYL